MRIMIIGFSGSGKSTLAKFLSELYHVPVLYMDKLQFIENWQDRDDAEARTLLKDFLNKNDSWVIDGNYQKREFNERAKLADKIIFMNFNRFNCLCRAIDRRIKYRNKTRESIAEGCKERMNPDFVWWILHDGRTKERVQNYLRLKEEYPNKFIEIKNQKELDLYKESCRKNLCTK